MILVVSSEKDTHAAVVLDQLARTKARAALLDLSAFPTRMQLSTSYRAGRAPDFRLRIGETGIALDDVRVVWWRRPQPFVVDAEVTNGAYRDFVLSESQEAFGGLWLALDAFWINHPGRDQAGARKVFQLKVAREVGLEIPTTLVTNSPQDARAFADALGPARTVYKAFSATAQHWRETRVLKTEEMSLLESVRFAPVIFQEYVPATADLRVTVMGEAVFAAAIYSQETSYPVDFRMDMDVARVEAFELPADVVVRLKALMARLGLVYGAIDMRLTPEGRYVFLEVNPAGQWMFVEHRTGQPMTETFVRLLASHDER